MPNNSGFRLDMPHIIRHNPVISIGRRGSRKILFRNPQGQNTTKGELPVAQNF